MPGAAARGEPRHELAGSCVSAGSGSEDEDWASGCASVTLLLAAMPALPSPAAASAGMNRRLAVSPKSPNVSSGCGANSIEFDAPRLPPSRGAGSAGPGTAMLLWALLSRAESSSVTAVGAVTNAASDVLTVLGAALAVTVGSGHGGGDGPAAVLDSAERSSSAPWGAAMESAEPVSLPECDAVSARTWLDPASLAGPSGMVLRSPGGHEFRLWPPSPTPPCDRRAGGPTGAGSVDARVAAKIARSICSARLGDCAEMALGPAMTGMGPTAAAVGVLEPGGAEAEGPCEGVAGRGGEEVRPLADARTGGLRRLSPAWARRRCGGGCDAGCRTGMTGALKDFDAFVEEAGTSLLDRTGAEAPCRGVET